MSQPRFIDNNDGTITDRQLRLMWKKEDSFQETKKWANWFKSLEYAQKTNAARFAGHSDWRLPTRDEAWGLFEQDKTNKDKYGDDIYLDPVFAPGSAGVIWTQETRDSSALVIQYEDGAQVWPSQYAHLNMAARLTRSLAP